MTIERHKMSPLDTPTQVLIKGSLDDHVFDELKHFYQINNYNGTDCLLLTAMEKVRKEKDALRFSVSQLKLCVIDLKVSVSTIKKLFSCGCRAEIAQNQTPSLILQSGCIIQNEFPV